MPSQVNVRGIEDNWFEQLIKARSHELISDEPMDHGGTDRGPTPYELLLAALGSCIAITVRMYAKKKNWPLQDVKVNLRHEKIHAQDCEECEEENGYVDVIEKQLEFFGDLTQAQLDRLAEIAGRCPVHRTLERSVKIRS